MYSLIFFPREGGCLVLCVINAASFCSVTFYFLHISRKNKLKIGGNSFGYRLRHKHKLGKLFLLEVCSTSLCYV